MQTSILNLADELGTRAAYHRYLQNKRNPVISFELFALAYGKKKVVPKTEDELRAEYRQFREDCARDLTSIEIECGGMATFEEFKLYYRSEGV